MFDVPVAAKCKRIAKAEVAEAVVPDRRSGMWEKIRVCVDDLG